MDTLPTTAPPTVDLLRSSLIDRVRAASPAILTLVAPAGFGKTTLVRQLLTALGGNVAVCDCSGAGSDVELVRRVLPALADEAPERSATLAMNESLLGEGHGSAADRVAKALTAWRIPPPRPRRSCSKTPSTRSPTPGRATCSRACSPDGPSSAWS